MKFARRIAGAVKPRSLVRSSPSTIDKNGETPTRHITRRGLVIATEIKLGQTQPYSGRAEVAFFQMVNEQGGIMKGSSADVLVTAATPKFAAQIIRRPTTSTGSRCTS